MISRKSAELKFSFDSTEHQFMRRFLSTKWIFKLRWVSWILVNFQDLIEQAQAKRRRGFETRSANYCEQYIHENKRFR